MPKKDDLPYMPFYIGDWKKDPGIQALTHEQKWIWFDMCCLMWESKERGYLTINKKPMTNGQLCNALSLDLDKLKFCLTYFKDMDLFSIRESDKAIYSRKMIKMQDIRIKRKNAGSLGGNPSLLNEGVNQKDNQNTESENENDIITNKHIIKDLFDVFYTLYPRKESKGDALNKWEKVTKFKNPRYIIKCLRVRLSTIKGKEKKFQKLPATWLNQQCWEDEVQPWKNKPKAPQNQTSMPINSPGIAKPGSNEPLPTKEESEAYQKEFLKMANNMKSKSIAAMKPLKLTKRG